MARAIKGKDGKFRGSIGDGKNNSPVPGAGIRTRSARLTAATNTADAAAYNDQYARFQQTQAPEPSFGLTPNGGMVRSTGRRWQAFNANDEFVGLYDTEEQARHAAENGWQ